MKVLLMDPQRPFDPAAPPPANAEQLTADLELETLFAAMAAGDPALHDLARAGVLAGVTESDPAVIRYRQAVLDDCTEQLETVQRLREIALEAITGERRSWGFGRTSPEGLLSLALRLLELFMGKLEELLAVAEQHGSAFASEGFRRLFAMLAEQLTDDYFSAVERQIEQLGKPTILVSAQLGPGNRASHYVLRSPWPESWRERLSPFRRRGLSFRVADRDEAGARAIGELRSRGINDAANAAAQSSDHISAFFHSLSRELGFYLSVINLQRRLTDLGLPLCVAAAVAPGRRRLSARGLYDPCLALTLDGPVVGNEIAADDRSAIVITGANQGGKSTFLRALGLAQVMMQAGMRVGAEAFTADARAGVFTHYKREEDADMRHGKLDEELERMSVIVGQLGPGSLLLSNESFASTNEREGSEIARQVLTALIESGVKVAFVTHLYDLAHRLAVADDDDVLFLRAERVQDGRRTFKIVPGAPLPTSYAEDSYARVFGSGPEGE